MSARRIPCLLLVAVALLAAPASSAPASTDVPQETAEISLQKLEVPGALTLLRTIVGTRGLKPIDEHTVGVTDSPEVVALARAVVDLAENPSDLAGEVATHTAPDGDAIASVRVQHAALADVANALRVKVAIKRMAFNDASSTVVVRDTPEQVQAALDTIRGLEQGPK